MRHFFSGFCRNSHLAVARACEKAEGGLLEISLDRHDRIVAAHLEALAWADKF
jgi:hypothetical protein